jgi:hypothetical protein
VQKPNWNKIRNEYISTKTSYRKLAEKYRVSIKTLEPRAKREEWAKHRAEQQGIIRAKTGQKTAEKIAERDSDINIDHAEINALIAKEARRLLKEGVNPQGLKAVSGAMRDIREAESNISIELNTKDPFDGLTTEELRKLAASGDEKHDK